MQQLFSAFGVNWSLLIAQAINFAIVLAALWYFLYKPVLSVLEKRRELVARSVRDAKKAEELFAKADSEAERRVNAADEEAQAIVAEAREAAHAERARLTKEAEARAVAIEKDARARAEEAKAKAAKESEREIARLAILAAEKVLEKHD